MRPCSWLTLASFTPLPAMTSFTGKGPWSKHPIWAAMVQGEGNGGSVSLYFSAQLFVLATSWNKIPNGKKTWCTWVSVRIFQLLMRKVKPFPYCRSRSFCTLITSGVDDAVKLMDFLFFLKLNQGNASKVLMMMVTMMKWILGCQWHN